MKLDWSFLKTRVARHIFFLFFFCALVPILGVAGFSYWSVTSELKEQSRERLDATLGTSVSSVHERLLFLDAELASLASDLTGGFRRLRSIIAEERQSQLSRRFHGLAVASGSGSVSPLLGDRAVAPRISDARSQLVRSEGSILITEADSGGSAIFLGRLLDGDDPNGRILWGQIKSSYVFGGGENNEGVPRDMELCAFDHTGEGLFCSASIPAPLRQQLQAVTAASTDVVMDRGQFEWSNGEEEYSAGYRSVFLRSLYGSPNWTIVLSESNATVLRPMDDFTKYFPYAILLALLFVFLVSNIQIKKSMEPLVNLQQGTQRIARREFGTPVRVNSGDEFEDLASSFNAMASRLRSQFNTLTALNEIDQVVLSAQDIDHIIDTVLSGTRRVLPCDGLSVSVLSGTGPKATWRLVAVADRDDEQIRHDIEIRADEEQELRNNPDHLTISGGPGSRSYLVISPFTTGGIRSFLVLPIFLKQQLSAVIALGYVSQPALSEEDLAQARQMADQVAVALSNTRLIDELDALNVGALTALARTIDAKSPWTAGHSERVTNMTLKIARQMGLDEAELEVLNRGGLLHDIGKIGIPAEILDKPAALNKEEMQVMRDHVTVGARILEPIAAYADVIPIVLWHHERWDGTGYPDGIAGEEIDFHARLLAAADVYDALTSHRPYRSGMPDAEAVAWIAGQSGTHFDPEVVKAFMAVISESPVRSDQATPLYRPAASLSERP